MKKSHRYLKAAAYALLIYGACAGLFCGMLRAAQQTRLTLYGGQPVMAQYSAGEAPAADTLTLGGGEWSFALPDPDHAKKAEAVMEQLPPCGVKCLLRVIGLAEAFADQTARRIGEISSLNAR